MGAAIFYGLKAPTVLTGALRGLGVGVAGTLGIVSAWFGFEWWAQSGPALPAAGFVAATTLLPCIAAGAIFAARAPRRK